MTSSRKVNKTVTDYLLLDEEEARQTDADVREDDLRGHCSFIDLSVHLGKLRRAAFSSGKRIYEELLVGWALNPPNENSITSATALVALLETGFWGTAERCLHQCCESESGRSAIRYLLSEHVTYLFDGYLGDWHIDLPIEDSQMLGKLMDGQTTIEQLAELRRNLSDHFSDSELRDVCFDMGVNYEDLSAEGKAGKVRELVSFLHGVGVFLS